MSLQGRTVEQTLARMAARSHGVATWAEMLGAGISADEIRHRVHVGSLIRVHRGVYRVGHTAWSIEAHYMAAVKACGPNAVLSGFAAAHLLSLLKGPPPAPEVTTTTERRVKGVITHRRRKIHARDITIYRHVPTTTVAATLVDVAPAEQLGRMFHEARIIHRTTARDVEAALARRPNAPGAANLRAVVRGDTRLTLSALERAFLRLLQEHGLPLPQTNRLEGGRYVDCRWPERRLTVELDSYLAHDSRHAWEQDHRRQREAYGRRDEFRSYTYEDVTANPTDMLRELTELLA